MQVSIVPFSKLEQNKRIDAEYFWPAYLDLDRVLSAKPSQPLTALCNVSDGNHMSVAQHFQTEKGVPYFRGQDVNTDFFLENAKPTFIPEDIYAIPFMKRSWFQQGDILLSIVGTIGSLSIVTDKIKKATGSCKIAILRPKRMSSEYIASFLQSKFGQFQIKRNTRGAVQQGLLLKDMERIKVYIPSDKLEKSICREIQDSIKLNRSSTEMYTDAHTLLYSELGFSDWQPKHQLTFIKNCSDTVQVNRIDAEYYQPKYDEIVQVIKSYSGGWDTLDNLVTIKKCVEVGNKEYLSAGIPFVRVSNLKPFEFTEEKYISEALYAKIAQHQPEQGEILLSKDATPGIAYYLRENPPKMIPSGGILRLKSKTDRINNEYLTLVLNSKLTKEQAKRDVGGTLILHWRPDQVKATIIPILPEGKQTQIQQKAVESLNLRMQSKHLLECAKRAVEIAIEQDEQTAIEWLESATTRFHDYHSRSKVTP